MEYNLQNKQIKNMKKSFINELLKYLNYMIKINIIIEYNTYIYNKKNLI